MGYTTHFDGKIDLDKPLELKHLRYLEAFNQTRHMKRDVKVVGKLEDPVREKVGLPIGDEGEYYVADESEGVLDNNSPPKNCPGLWCQWVPTEDGESIVWDEGEKFYDYVEWMVYILNILDTWGYKANGKIKWAGEDNDDTGTIIVKDNHLKTVKGNSIEGLALENDEEQGPWENNAVQFPRLLAEINAVGLTKAQYAKLQESMDLSKEEIDQILQRAEDVYEGIKENI